ncbi:Apc13p protein [Yamadazyma tenuis]|uniref:Uncharacterized protein n=1 Tax=Candida tenuis (strain ATCC 10573 / BCRC 21748 / CBS 615 / JCM 9827 / NBRC 10315 / NRRL Y-1498 / VKM Y-70) TaxID=590646 RepID=G3B9E3_CANTC|nr:uncharacterized protein CANTEDRAFT_107812 [Yamadazyma tenuis ATCC 10573]EGV61864.1 hypothetical protein CANTEDRAFT_107812 [Yamadazyma tenuis ATCC 10573]WEJ93093.1 Apc13p protein [Yamadazyma tenuis]
MYGGDGNYTFVHFTNPNQVLYMEKWSDEDPIPFDDIDTHSLFEATSSLFPQFLLEDEEDGGMPLNPANFSANYYKNKRLLRDVSWSDNGIFDKFLKEGNESDNRADKTILKPLHSKASSETDEFPISQFLSNGFAAPDNLDMISSHDINDSIMGHNTSDISINLNTDFIPPNFPMPKRNNSNSNVSFANGPVQTPKVARVRQPSNDRTYQTPVARISRRTFTE